MNNKKSISVRWLYLIIGVVAMLFAGVLYAWSILKAPLATEFGWGVSELALCFTLAMTFFCIGGLVGAKISQKSGHRIALSVSATLALSGFGLTAVLKDVPVAVLYLTYGVLAGFGIGIAYNVVVATVSRWFPDRKGLCSGCLMMGFGASALVLGNVASSLFASSIGWRGAFWIIGAAIFAVILTSGLLIKLPSKDTVLPSGKNTTNTSSAESEVSDFTALGMLKRPSFLMAFTFLSLLASVGCSVISFAKDLALSVDAPEALAVSLVGVLSVCNGIGRIVAGAVFDLLGCRRTMVLANLITTFAALITLAAVLVHSVPFCVIGLCLVGMSYGFCPTISTAFTSSFYGMKHFSDNMAIMTFTVMVASFAATASNKVLEATGGYEATFVMLIAFTVVAFVLNLFIKRP